MSVLGAGTALLGKEAAMACTVAVESVIGEHYNKWETLSSWFLLSFILFISQLRDLMEHADPTKDKELIEIGDHQRCWKNFLLIFGTLDN